MLNKLKLIFNNEKYKFLLQYYIIVFSRGIQFLKQFAVLLLDDITTPMQASMIVSISAIASLLLTIPINFVSNKIGCKKTIMISMILFISSYVGLLYSRNVYTFAFYYFCIALYNAMYYTLLEVLIYGNVKYLNVKDLFAKYKSISKAGRFVAVAIASYIGGMIVYKNPKLIFVIDIITLLLAIYTMAMMPERKTQGSVKLGKNYLKSFLDSCKYIVKHRIVRNLFLFEAFLSAILSFISIYRSLYCEEIAVNSYNIGLMLSLQTILTSIFQIVYTKTYSKKPIISQEIFFVLSGICFVISSIHYHSLFSYILFTFSLMFLEAGETMNYSKMIGLIPDRFMTATLSVSNLVSNFAKILLIHVFGYMSHNYSYKVAFCVVTLILLIVVSLEYIKIKQEEEYFLKKQM